MKKYSCFNSPLVNDMDFFKEKLMSMYDWSLEYTEKVIFEYRKFMFLAVQFRVAPSWEIDQVWHLHLLYTDYYWNVWCKKVLKKKIHHNPNPKNFNSSVDEYFETKKIYLQVFGYIPPPDVWTNWKKSNYKYIDSTFFNHLKQLQLCLQQILAYFVQ